MFLNYFDSTSDDVWIRFNKRLIDRMNVKKGKKGRYILSYFEIFHL